MSWPRRYTAGARFYDVLSGERPVYRVGRERAISLLGLERGDTVLDVGCGTGLNLPLLREAVGPTGRIVGVDASLDMLEQARDRAAGWPGVTLLHADAAAMADAIAPWTFDAMIATYSLSIIADWREAWELALARLRPGARVAVVDSAPPRGLGRLFSPLAGLAFLTGGVHPAREVWRLVPERLGEVTCETHRSGHVVLAVGTVP